MTTFVAAGPSFTVMGLANVRPHRWLSVEILASFTTDAFPPAFYYIITETLFAMIDITGIKAKEGDVVEIFGKNLPCDELAGLINTINYELVCSVSRRIPRIYFKQNKIVRIENYIAG